MKRAWLAAILAGMGAPAAWAQAPGAQAMTPLSTGSVVQVVLMLLAVLAVIGGLAWMLRRWQGGSVPGGAGLRVIGGLSLGARERIVLVQHGKTRLLLGVAPGRVQTLHVIEGAEDEAPAAPTPFAERLRGALGGRSG